MSAEQRRKEYLVILFIAGGLALNYPLLSLFDRLLLPLGTPLLYLYVFLVWLAVIIITAVIIERFRSDDA